MNTKHLLRISRFSLATLALLPTFSYPPSASAQVTAFTYQGRLIDTNNSPADGLYDFQFTVYVSAINPGSVAGPISRPATIVSNGLFTVTLDFGSAAFPGFDRWLGIEVRTNGSGPFITLSPRQELTPTPYAITAQNLLNGGLFGNPVNFNNPANTFCGDGGCLTNVNATTIGGLTSANFWQLTGNTVSSSSFLGTLNNFPLEIKVNNNHALRLVPATVPSLEGGYIQNSTHGSLAAAIVGGGASGLINEVLGNYGFVGAGYGAKAGMASAVVGGANNVASGQYSFVGAGQINTNLADYSVIGGGNNNHIGSGSIYAFVGAGFNNTASGTSSTIAGGGNNIADFNAAAVVGGSENHAGGDHSYIGGGQGNAESAGYATIGGGAGNVINALAGTIAGGWPNTIQPGANYSSIGGGANNLIQTNSTYSTIAGGKNNAVNDFAGNTAPYAAIGGGEGNTILPENLFEAFSPGDHSVIGGGYSNTIWGIQSVISGGGQNLIIYGAQAATIPGGQSNEADGYCSFAAGQRAKAYGSGCFVWADSQAADFPSTANDQFCIRAQGGVQLSTNTSVFCGQQTRQMLNLWGTQYGIGVQTLNTYFRSDFSYSWFRGGVHNDAQFNPGAGGTEIMRLDASGLRVNGTFVSASDRNLKENFEQVDGRAVLEKVAALPVSSWNYKSDQTSRHLGPMAQDFYAAFGVGPDDKHITTIDEGGVALAAIQGLNEKVDEKDAEIQSLKQQNDSLERRLNQMEALLKQLTNQK